jgi:hypothetical protein
MKLPTLKKQTFGVQLIVIPTSFDNTHFVGDESEHPPRHDKDKA